MEPNRESDKLMLRMPEGLRDKVKTAAAANFRSMNSEVVYQLQKAYSEGENEKSGTTA